MSSQLTGFEPKQRNPRIEIVGGGVVSVEV